MNFLNLLLCPYCKTNFHVIESNDQYIPEFGSVTCECDTFPILHSIIYCKKDDSLLHRRLVDLIRVKKYSKAVWLSLSDQAKIHRILFIIFYFLWTKSYNINELFLLKLFLFFGPSRKWFSYLINSPRRDTLLLAKKIINVKKDVIIDVGCGWGLLNAMNSKGIYIGLDKSLLSLICAQIFRKSKKSLFLCVDVEIGLPLSNSIAHQVIFLDSFAWIYQKQYLIAESFRILKNKGKIRIINVHSPMQSNKWWGYGIHYKVLKKYISSYFTNITFIKNSLNSRGEVQVTKNISKEGYSCLAVKKV